LLGAQIHISFSVLPNGIPNPDQYLSSSVYGAYGFKCSGISTDVGSSDREGVIDPLKTFFLPEYNAVLGPLRRRRPT
jgi:hypothetical protein